MTSQKKEIIDEVAQELDVEISRVNPLKSEWENILEAVKEKESQDYQKGVRHGELIALPVISKLINRLEGEK